MTVEIEDVFSPKLIAHIEEKGFCPCLDCLEEWLRISKGFRKFLVDIEYDRPDDVSVVGKGRLF